MPKTECSGNAGGDGDGGIYEYEYWIHERQNLENET